MGLHHSEVEAQTYHIHRQCLPARQHARPPRYTPSTLGSETSIRFIHRLRPDSLRDPQWRPVLSPPGPTPYHLDPPHQGPSNLWSSLGPMRSAICGLCPSLCRTQVTRSLPPLSRAWRSALSACRTSSPPRTCLHLHHHRISGPSLRRAPPSRRLPTPIVALAVALRETGAARAPSTPSPARSACSRKRCAPA